MPRKCILNCGRDAEVSDRNAAGRPIKVVCRICHAERLRQDLKRIMEGAVKSQRIALAQKARFN